jgi:UDP-N-acetylmuramate--alanine ligase
VNLASQRFHLVGIGGAGMSALARLLHGDRAVITGSDAVGGPTLDVLRGMGMEIWVSQHPERIVGENGYVVRSAAVPATDAEVVECERRGFTSLLYAEAVGRLSEGRRTLAIAGTHGKTSTTAMTVAALRGSGMDPSHLIGGDVPQLGGNGHSGASDLLVVEACEFNRSFHQLRPFGAAILNVDHDHFDCFPSTGDVLAAFAGYAARVRPGGIVLVEETVGKDVLAAVDGDVRVLRVGSGLFADVRAVDVADELGCYSFVPMFEGRRLPRVQLAIPGRFQMDNALFALGLAMAAGADGAGACRGLAAFAGVRRRFEVRDGPLGGRLISDYAHHPAEISAVIRAARRRYPGKRLVVAFQPHQHQRTLALLANFAEALSAADHSLIADIYGARESAEMRAAVRAEDLVAAVQARGGSCRAAGAITELPALLRELRSDEDLVMLLGAGDIDGVVERVVSVL